MRNILSRATVATAAITISLSWAGVSSAGGPDSAHHGRGTSGIFWFMHISDTHIGASSIEGPHAPEHMLFALNEAVATIDPTFVTVTGDLVDGSRNHIPALGQEQAEWDDYAQIYSAAGMTPDFFYDLPGNHDGYDDLNLTYYLANSLQGQTNGALFTSWVVQTPVGEHFFFGLNSAGNGSPPFVEDPEFTADEIAALESGLEAHADAELTFVLAHHNLSRPSNHGQVEDALVTHGGAFYLHGHRHAYSEYVHAGIVCNEVDSLGKGNSNNIAIGVVDHNAFIYRATDVDGAWPLVMISTPVSSTLRGGQDANPYAYDVCLDRPDNPFRAEVFAMEAPTEVTVEVDGLAPTPMALVDGHTSLWEAEIDTSSLQAGTHDVTVSATVGAAVAQETITASFVDGPCEELPTDDVPAGGSGGEGGMLVGGSGGAPAGGAGGSGGDLSLPLAAPTESDGGCGCRVVASEPSRRGGFGLLLGSMFGSLGVMLIRRRRRGGAR